MRKMIELYMSKRKYKPDFSTELGERLNIRNIELIYPAGDIRKEYKSLSVLQNSWSNSIKNIDHDHKFLTNLLNKINESNYDELVEELKKYKSKSIDNLIDNKIINAIFQKSIMEPTYNHLYIKLCIDLDLQSNINSICLEKVKTNPNKGLIIFICELYHHNVLSKDSFNLLLIKLIDSANIEAILIISNYRLGYFKTNKEIAEKLKNMDMSGATPRLKFMYKDFLKTIS